MSHFGRFQSSPTTVTTSEKCARNGKLPHETFRLVDPNITKHLTARIRSEAEVQIKSIMVRKVLIVAVQEQVVDWLNPQPI